MVPPNTMTKLAPLTNTSQSSVLIAMAPKKSPNAVTMPMIVVKGYTLPSFSEPRYRGETVPRIDRFIARTLGGAFGRPIRRRGSKRRFDTEHHT